MNDLITIDTKEKYKILYDPIRQDIISSMRKLGKPVTVKDVANDLDIPHGKIYYHVKKLLTIDAIILDHTKSINGITAKYYLVDFKNIRIPVKSKLMYKNEYQENELNNRLKERFNENFNGILESQELVKKRIDEEQEVFGVHTYSEDIYLTFEERRELWKMVDDFIDKKRKIKPDTKKTTKTRIFANIYDLEIYDE